MKDIFSKFAKDLHNAMSRATNISGIHQSSSGNNSLVINGSTNINGISQSGTGSNSLIINGNTSTGGMEPAGPMSSKVVDIYAFSTLEADSVFNITVRLGPEPKLTFTAEERILDQLEAYQSGDRLELAVSGSFTTGSPVRADLVVPSLSGIDLSGAAKLVFEGVAGNTLRVEASGSAQVQLEGAVALLVVNAEGAAKIRAQNLVANDVKVDASGAANVKVCAISGIRGEASGAASLKVSGTATNRAVRTSGAASVKYA